MKKLFCLMFVLLSFGMQGQAQPSSALIAEAESGYLLIKDNVHEELPPASLTKVMTLYLTFGVLEKGWLKWEDKLPVSENAASQPRTNLNLMAGQTLTVREAVLSLIVHSANDAAVVLAESMAADESQFAQMMTQTASLLNMKHTVFKNASGLHEEGQVTTAQDMAILALAMIRHYPQYYPLFSTTTFEYNGKKYETHNRILKEYQGAEGLKTGYVAAGGYNLISTVKKDDVRLVGVVLGKETSQERDSKMTALLDGAFQKVFHQKEAVYSGKLSPAFDPLHRHAFLQKMDLDPFSALMKYQISLAKKTAMLYSKQEKLLQKLEAIEPIPNDFSSDWLIQVGAFRSHQNAQKRIEYSLALLGKPALQPLTQRRGNIYKAQLRGFPNKKFAQNACSELQKKECPCFLVAPIEGGK